MLTIVPLVSLSCSTKAMVTLKGPCTFTAMVRSQRSRPSAATRLPRRKMPALLTRMRIGPTSSDKSRASLRAALLVGDVEHEAARLAALGDDRIGDDARRVLVDVGDDHLGAGGRQPARDRRAVAAAGAGHQGEAAQQHVLHELRRRLQRLADHLLVADMVDQQQDQPRVVGAALLLAQAFVGVDDGVVDLVRLAEVERASQRAFHRRLPSGRSRAPAPHGPPSCRTAASAPRRSGRAGSDRSCRAGRRSASPPSRCIPTQQPARRLHRSGAVEAQQGEIRPQPVDQPAVAHRRIDHRPARRPGRPSSRRRRRACRAASRYAPSAPTAGRC